LTKGLYETADALSPWSKQGIKENPGFRTTDAQGSRGIHRAKQGDHRDQVTSQGYYAVTRFLPPRTRHFPSFACHQHRDGRPELATMDCRHHFERRYEMNLTDSSWQASFGSYLLRCWLTKGLHETADAMSPMFSKELKRVLSFAPRWAGRSSRPSRETRLPGSPPCRGSPVA